MQELAHQTPSGRFRRFPLGRGKTTGMTVQLFFAQNLGPSPEGGDQGRRLTSRAVVQIAVQFAFDNAPHPVQLGAALSQAPISEGPQVVHVQQGHPIQIARRDHIAHRPNELSGGQRQRVAVARALVTHPDIVLADEPTANLDSKTSVQIIELMKRINAERGSTFIFSTHKPDIVALSDHAIHLQDGLVVSEQRHSPQRPAAGSG